MVSHRAQVQFRPQWFWGLVFATSISAIGHCARAGDVWLITDHGHPVQAVPGARIIELDAPSRIENQLSRQLPSDPSAASAIVERRLRNGRAVLQELLSKAYQGVTDAWSLGITKVPAVVVDRRYVVYGVSDVNRAVLLIEAYRTEHQ